MNPQFLRDAGIYAGHIQTAPEINSEDHPWLFSELRAARMANGGIPVSSLPVDKQPQDTAYTERLLELGDSAILG